jgi:hypothetical protein
MHVRERCSGNLIACTDSANIVNGYYRRDGARENAPETAGPDPMPRENKKFDAPKEKSAEEPFYFVSYSTGEPQIALLVECLEIVFRKHFKIKLTPSSLEVGKSQHDVILDQIRRSAFGVVCLDGLRPNVIFEYGAMKGANKGVLLLKEATATVDIAHFFAGAASLALPPPAIDMDKHFSNTKDRFYKTWNRFELKNTVKTIWESYKELRNEIDGYVEIPEPKL